MVEGPRLIKILAVDDEPDSNELVLRAFHRSFDYEVVVTESAEEALKLLEQEPVDVILADQSMPGMTGVVFLRKARLIRPEAVSIMVTGFPELVEVAAAQDEGVVTRIIAKPWRPDELLAAVRRALLFREHSSVMRGLAREGK